MQSILESSRVTMTERLEEWYSEWSKPCEEKRVVVGASYHNAPHANMVTDLYNDGLGITEEEGEA